MREFKIGQNFCYQRHSAEARYVVTRLVSQPNSEPRYIIRSEDDPSCEYTAEASELRNVPTGR
jgi:hypothetical protein